MATDEDNSALFFRLVRALFDLFTGIATVITELLAWATGSIAHGLHERNEQQQRQEEIQRLSARYDTKTLTQQTKDLIEGAHFPQPDDFISPFLSHLSETFKGRMDAVPVPAVFEQILEVAAALYEEEHLYEFTPTEAFSGAVEAARYRDQLLARQKKLADPTETAHLFTETLVRAFTNYAKQLPPSALTPTLVAKIDSQYSLPLREIIDVPRVVENLIVDFSTPKPKEIGLFAALSAQLLQNAKEAVVAPTKFKGDDLVDTYLKETPLSWLFDALIPFQLPEEARFSGHWLIAPPGRGKTTLLHNMMLEDIEKDAAIVLMDSRGDLIESIKILASIKDRLLLIEPNPDAAFALNPLDVSHSNVTQAVGLIEYIMAGLLDAKFTALQSTLFRNVVPAIIEAIPNPTLDTFKEVMVRGLPNLDKLNPHARQFFENRETGFHSKTYDSTRKEVVWRLDYLLTNPVMRSMFSATHTRLDLGQEMDAGKVIIINNSKAVLGDEGAEFFGRFFVALIARAAQQRSGRPAATKKPCYVYIDECQSVIAKDTRIPVLLDECRSQKIALILAHQRTAQLTPPVLDAVANCAIRMANSDDEAKYLSSKLRMDAEVLQSLPRGTFGTFVRDLTPQGIQLKVSKVDLDTLPKMTDAEFDAIRTRMKTDFASIPPSTSDTLRPVAPAAERKAIEAAPSSQPNTPVAEATGAADPGEPADKW